MQDIAKAGIAALLLCGWLASPVAIRADVTTYNYTGGPLGPDLPSAVAFDPNFTSVTGYFTVGAALAANLPLAPVPGITAFSFSDGAQTFNSSTTTSALFEVSTGLNGAINGWEVVLVGNVSNNAILSCFNANTAVCTGPGWGFPGEGDEALFPGYLGVVEPNTGRWAATPEPGLYGLLLLGLAGLAWRARRPRATA